MLHMHFLLNSVPKYTDNYYIIGLLALKGVLVVERGSIPYIHLYMKCVHKYTGIYGGIGLRVLKGVLVVHREIFSISISVFISS